MSDNESDKEDIKDKNKDDYDSDDREIIDDDLDIDNDESNDDESDNDYDYAANNGLITDNLANNSNLNNNLSSDIDNIKYNDQFILSNENLHKFDDDIKNDYIKKDHPEILKIDNTILSKYLKVVRDNNNNIVDKFHKTLPILTKYELTKVLGLRVKQLNNNSKPYIKVNENINDNYTIANLELQQRVLPYIIKRPIPNNTFEYWRLSDLQII